MSEKSSIVDIGEVLPKNLVNNQFYLRGNQAYCFKKICDSQCTYWNKSQNISCSNSTVQLTSLGPGVNIRRAIIARPGYKIVTIDYSQIEIRVAAQLSREPFWLRLYDNESLDLHTEMAKLAFKTDHPTSDQRRAAKAANFNLIYLGSPKTLHANSDLTLEEAVETYHKWWDVVSVYKNWTDTQIYLGTKVHYQVQTYSGRVRDLRSMLETVQASSEGKRDKKLTLGYVHRTCINTRVQGTAADIMKEGMVRVRRWIKKHHAEEYIKILLTVHDELVLEIKEDANFVAHCRKVSDLLSELPFNGQEQWTVPIKTDIEIGDNWAELEYLHEYEAKQSKTCKESDSRYIPLESAVSNEKEAVIQIDYVLPQHTHDRLGNLIRECLCRDPMVLSVPLVYSGFFEGSMPAIPRHKTSQRVIPTKLEAMLHRFPIPGVRLLSK